MEVDLLNKPLVQLLWDAPVSREDGTPFDPSTEVGSYNIYWGQASGDVSNNISIAGNTLYQDFDFDILPLPLHLVMTTVDNEGRESAYSGEFIFAKKIYAPNAPTGIRIYFRKQKTWPAKLLKTPIYGTS